MSRPKPHDCPPDGRTGYANQHCAGFCREGHGHLLTTGRGTAYCPECSCCPECGCPDVDGFAHYAGCSTKRDVDAEG